MKESEYEKRTSELMAAAGGDARTSISCPAMRRRSSGFVGSALSLLLGLSGCASSENSPEFEIESARYADAFAAVKGVLRSYRFQIDRVDAAAGVITTRPKATAGLATPWDKEQSGLAQEFEDFANDQQRRVRVTFEPRSPAPPEAPATGLAGGPVTDLRSVEGTLLGRVVVVVDRVQRPGWRLSPKAIGTSTVTIDTALAARGLAPVYTVPISQDPRLAERMGGAIRKRLAVARKENANVAEETE